MANFRPKAVVGLLGAAFGVAALLVVAFIIFSAGSTHIPDDNTITDVDAPEVLTNPADGLTYVWIPPGKFIMGCSPADIDVRDHPDDPYSRCWHQEEPAHQVTLTGGFWLGKP